MQCIAARSMLIPERQIADDDADATGIRHQTVVSRITFPARKPVYLWGIIPIKLLFQGLSSSHYFAGRSRAEPLSGPGARVNFASHGLGIWGEDSADGGLTHSPSRRQGSLGCLEVKHKPPRPQFHLLILPPPLLCRRCHLSIWTLLALLYYYSSILHAMLDLDAMDAAFWSSSCRCCLLSDAPGGLQGSFWPTGESKGRENGRAKGFFVQLPSVKAASRRATRAGGAGPDAVQ